MSEELQDLIRREARLLEHAHELHQAAARGGASAQALAALDAFARPTNPRERVLFALRHNVFPLHVTQWIVRRSEGYTSVAWHRFDGIHEYGQVQHIADGTTDHDVCRQLRSLTSAYRVCAARNGWAQR